MYHMRVVKAVSSLSFTHYDDTDTTFFGQLKSSTFPPAVNRLRNMNRHSLGNGRRTRHPTHPKRNPFNNFMTIIPHRTVRSLSTIFFVITYTHNHSYISGSRFKQSRSLEYDDAFNSAKDVGLPSFFLSTIIRYASCI